MGVGQQTGIAMICQTGSMDEANGGMIGPGHCSARPGGRCFHGRSA